MWNEHSSSRCHVANADPFSITDRYHLTNGYGNVCRQRGVWSGLFDSAWTTPNDDAVTPRHARL